MPRPTFEDYKQSILNKLEAAGTEGLPKKKLEPSTSNAAKQAYQELINDRKIIKTQLGNKIIYFAEPFFQPLELAYDKIEAFAHKQELKAFAKGKIDKEVKTFAVVKKRFGEAIDLLVQEKKLLKFKTGNYFSYLSADRVKEALDFPTDQTPPGTPQPASEDENHFKQRVYQAFEKLTRQSGFSAVEIYHLHREAQVPLDWLKQYILELRKERKAEIHFGDWHHSDDKIRSGVIEENGEKYLLTRLLP